MMLVTIIFFNLLLISFIAEEGNKRMGFFVANAFLLSYSSIHDEWDFQTLQSSDVCFLVASCAVFGVLSCILAHILGRLRQTSIDKSLLDSKFK